MSAPNKIPPTPLQLSRRPFPGWAGLAILALLALSGLVGAAFALAEESDPVLAAAQGVFRVVAGAEISDLANDGTSLVTDEGWADIKRRGWTTALIDGNIVTLFASGDRIYAYRGNGSAYLVSSDGYWVTNAHVAEASPHLFLLTVLVPKLEIQPLEVVWSDTGRDLAILKAAPPAGASPLVFADTEQIVRNLPITDIGFSRVADDLSRRDETFADPEAFLTPKITQGVLSNAYTHPDGTRMWQYQASSSEGSSGGPVVNQCGQVVGTIAEANPEKYTFCGAIDLNELLPELRRLDIAFRQAAGSCRPTMDRSLERLVYMSLGLAALLALALAAFWVNFRKRLKDGRPVPKLVTKMATIMGGLNEGRRHKDVKGVDWIKDINGRWYRFDQILGVIYKDESICGLDGIDSPALYLRSDRFGEVRLRLGQSVVLGANKAKAEVVIADKLVSGAHLRLTNWEGVILVEDLGSANGTFIDGQRLAGPKVLEPGQALDLTPRPGRVEFHLVDIWAAAPKGGWTAAVVPQFAGGRVVPLAPGRPVGIGRATDNVVTLADPAVSAHHCRVTAFDDGRIELLDLDSRNGVFLARQPCRVTRAELRPGLTFYVVKRLYAFKVIDG